MGWLEGNGGWMGGIGVVYRGFLYVRGRILGYIYIKMSIRYILSECIGYFFCSLGGKGIYFFFVDWLLSLC